MLIIKYVNYESQGSSENTTKLDRGSVQAGDFVQLKKPFAEANDQEVQEVATLMKEGYELSPNQKGSMVKQNRYAVRSTGTNEEASWNE
tara:strand:- start:897 stop:1163 length:267 start_codon:yes stop_codon:yes gene_type:complete